MSRAYTYDWSSLDRQSLFDLMYLVKDQVQGKPIKVNKFHSIVSKHIKSFLPIRSCKGMDAEAPKGHVLVGGTYHSYYDKERKKSIDLCIDYNPTDKVILMSRLSFNRFCTGVADSILHEIIHMRQFRRRKFKSIPYYTGTAEKSKQRKEQSYLGDADEIGAYSFNIACELNDKFKGNTKKVIEYLNESRRIKLKGKNSWTMYLRAFDYNHNHEIIKRVKKRVMYYVTRNQLNKPFQSKDWISQ